MADNPSIDPGTSPTMPVASDDVGGVQYQRIKLRAADDGSAGTDASATNPFPMVDTALGTLVGAVNEGAPSTDTASSGLNGRLQRISQRLTALLPASLGQKTMANGLAVTIASDQSTVPVSNASLPLPTGASTETTLAAANTAIGTTADTASSTTGTVIAHLRKIRDVLVAGLPALVGGRVPVDGSGVTQPVSGPVTDTQLRATAVPVSGPLTDTQLRATAVPVSNASLPLPTGTATIGDGRQVVTTAGTAVQFASQACKQVSLTALSTNTGIVVIGASTVVAAAGTRRGIALFAGDSVTLDLSNINLLYIDSTVNGEGVSFLWEA